VVIHYEETLYQVYAPLPLPATSLSHNGQRRQSDDVTLQPRPFTFEITAVTRVIVSIRIPSLKFVDLPILVTVTALSYEHSILRELSTSVVDYFPSTTKMD